LQRKPVEKLKRNDWRRKNGSWRRKQSWRKNVWQRKWIVSTMIMITGRQHLCGQVITK